jgi:hypothetical protein
MNHNIITDAGLTTVLTHLPKTMPNNLPPVPDEKDTRIEELERKLAQVEMRNRVLETTANKYQGDYFDAMQKLQKKQANLQNAPEIIDLMSKELQIMTRKYNDLLEKYGRLAAADVGILTDELGVAKGQIQLLSTKLKNLAEYNEEEIGYHKKNLEKYNQIILTGESEAWYWQPEGENHLNSLVCPLVIHMTDLSKFVDHVLAIQQLSFDEMLKEL